jgi:multiple sugar transport system permease protein
MKRFRRAALYAGLAALLAASLYPLVWMFVIALRVPGDGGWRPSLEHFVSVWRSGPFDRYFLNSVWVAAWVVGANMLLASMVGYALARRSFRGRRVLVLGVLATLMVPRQVTMIPVYLLFAKMHWIDTYAALIVPFAVDAFNVFLMSQYIQTIPEELEDAARVDGAGDFAVFFRVVLPLARPALAVVAINTFLTNWNSFLYPLILTHSESMRTLPVGLALYAQGEHSVDWGPLMAGSALATIPILLVFLVFQRYIIEGITRGALKG